MSSVRAANAVGSACSKVPKRRSPVGSAIVAFLSLGAVLGLGASPREVGSRQAALRDVGCHPSPPGELGKPWLPSNTVPVRQAAYGATDDQAIGSLGGLAYRDGAVYLFDQLESEVVILSQDSLLPIHRFGRRGDGPGESEVPPAPIRWAAMLTIGFSPSARPVLRSTTERVSSCSTWRGCSSVGTCKGFHPAVCLDFAMWARANRTGGFSRLVHNTASWCQGFKLARSGPCGDSASIASDGATDNLWVFKSRHRDSRQLRTCPDGPCRRGGPARWQCSRDPGTSLPPGHLDRRAPCSRSSEHH